MAIKSSYSNIEREYLDAKQKYEELKKKYETYLKRKNNKSSTKTIKENQLNIAQKKLKSSQLKQIRKIQRYFKNVNELALAPIENLNKVEGVNFKAYMFNTLTNKGIEKLINSSNENINTWIAANKKRVAQTKRRIKKYNDTFKGTVSLIADRVNNEIIKLSEESGFTPGTEEYPLVKEGATLADIQKILIYYARKGYRFDY